MNIESFKHDDKRPLIPSSEEAGMEAANPVVQSGPQKAEYPKNPVVRRGQDPELFWMNKYGSDDADDLLNVDIRSLYRHEHISPEVLIEKLYRLKEVPQSQLALAEMFGNVLEMDELEKVGSYYEHHDGWQNRLIQGDSLLVMTSLLEREGMAGKVQCIYIDPPYGIKYGSNWQVHMHKTTLDDTDNDLSGEPEQIKAYRDTWELGVHSYLSYLRDRLVASRVLLDHSGSCFVQISEESLHLVRSLMDEVFGSENAVSQISFRKKTMPLGAKYLEQMHDFILWYARSKEDMKYRQLYKEYDVKGLQDWKWVEETDGNRREMTSDEFAGRVKLPPDSRVFRLKHPAPIGQSEEKTYDYEFQGVVYKAPSKGWGIERAKMDRLVRLGRVQPKGNLLNYILYYDDYPITVLTNPWYDTVGPQDKRYVVQTDHVPVQRCILMTTDPGDLILDPTCGSGTTAHVAEQWGRRWITTDTSRIALNIAKQRLMTATLPYYRLHDEEGRDIRQGFIYKKVPHITLKSLANDEPPAEETLYDQPEIDNKKLRVAGPFTIETLQNFEPVSPEEINQTVPQAEELERFEERIFEHLKSAGVKTGIKEERAVFTRIQRLSSAFLHAEGFYQSAKGEKKAYLHIGPKFGTVSRQAVNEAVKECRQRGDGDWLIILGFSFESDISGEAMTQNAGTFKVTKARMHDDLMQDGLLKKDKKAGSFVTIGEPDIALLHGKDGVQVEIRALDIYDPIQDRVKPRDIADIAYWMVDEDYDGSNFIVRQVFFCGSDDKDEFAKWKKGLENLAVAKRKKDVEKTLRIEIDHDAFQRLYGHKSHPIQAKPGQKIAVRVISQFGEESTKVLEV